MIPPARLPLVLLLLSSPGCHLVFPYSVGADGADRGQRDGPRRADGRACLLGQTASGACRRLAPSNGVVPTVDCRDVDVRLTVDVTIDTSVGRCEAPGAVSGCRVASVTDGYCTVLVRSLTIPAGRTLSVVGNQPLVVLVEEAQIDGKIDASAHGPTPGPGGKAGGQPAKASPLNTGRDGQGLGGGKACACHSIHGVSFDGSFFFRLI